MKKVVFILFGALLTTGAFAQNKQAEEKQLRNDVREVKKQRSDVKEEVKDGKLDKAVQEHKDVKAAKAMEHKHAKHLKQAHGVKHPITKAQ
ncbi:MAG: hypothetical protein HY305_02160, partial [Sphingobacteriales bacterium]|nr:hypothetical protein [Sphingobacteriales bacterium]